MEPPHLTGERLRHLLHRVLCEALHSAVLQEELVRKGSSRQNDQPVDAEEPGPKNVVQGATPELGCHDFLVAQLANWPMDNVDREGDGAEVNQRLEGQHACDEPWAFCLSNRGHSSPVEPHEEHDEEGDEEQATSEAVVQRDPAGCTPHNQQNHAGKRHHGGGQGPLLRLPILGTVSHHQAAGDRPHEDLQHSVKWVEPLGVEHQPVGVPPWASQPLKDSQGVEIVGVGNLREQPHASQHRQAHLQAALAPFRNVRQGVGEDQHRKSQGGEEPGWSIPELSAGREPGLAEAEGYEAVPSSLDGPVVDVIHPQEHRSKEHVHKEVEWIVACNTASKVGNCRLDSW
mmetsp:Transcript_2209/g.6539  ORF Transcript_2209/g.6539 Transcript_2209/m.6539 type:complete len:344 (-) Transcript_2209:704-1735(-)